MLYPIYTAVKNRLNTADIENKIQGIEWYNVQYEGSIAKTPRCFIEFPEALKFDPISKDARRTPLKIRVHVVIQAIAGADGAVSDAVAEEHEAISYLVQNALDKFTPVSGGQNLSSALQFSGWQHWHKYRGWMVTFVEFDARKMM